MKKGAIIALGCGVVMAAITFVILWLFPYTALPQDLYLQVLDLRIEHTYVWYFGIPTLTTLPCIGLSMILLIINAVRSSPSAH